MVRNDCNGSFELESEVQIEIKRGFCSLVGGEPDFSQELYGIIINSGQYYSLHEKLTFYFRN